MAAPAASCLAELHAHRAGRQPRGRTVPFTLQREAPNWGEGCCSLKESCPTLEKGPTPRRLTSHPPCLPACTEASCFMAAHASPGTGHSSVMAVPTVGVGPRPGVLPAWIPMYLQKHPSALLPGLHTYHPFQSRVREHIAMLCFSQTAQRTLEANTKIKLLVGRKAKCW